MGEQTSKKEWKQEWLWGNFWPSIAIAAIVSIVVYISSNLYGGNFSEYILTPGRIIIFLFMGILIFGLLCFFIKPLSQLKVKAKNAQSTIVGFLCIFRCHYSTVGVLSIGNTHCLAKSAYSRLVDGLYRTTDSRHWLRII